MSGGVNSIGKQDSIGKLEQRATPQLSESSDNLWARWPRTWVPLASTVELDPDRPTKLQFLERNYVTYRDNLGVWRVLDDACSHRLAPLSEGRVDRDNDALECA